MSGDQKPSPVGFSSIEVLPATSASAPRPVCPPWQIISLMRRSAIRKFVGIVAFLLPIPVAVIGVRLDHSTLGHDPIYGALALPVLLTSVGLAAVVPGALIMTSKLSRPKRVGLTVAMLCLLALECGFTFYVAMLSQAG